ncbi:hypothetical protein BV898_05252 [Hypsibius exemplaris]|uniref:Reverse transcriptase domain-containing protein n=1 Tax=Hypsibius exemplaris TaxID=2072580 RepID=A0A1W0WZS8_HYPEX|nr:hypothetical protein BV898_05252 [Hypsibius exemplaris]
MDFLESNSSTQFGFRAGRSTEDQLLQMTHDWSQSLGRKKQVDVIFLDCTKTFDRVSHDVILRSLASHGIIGEIFHLLADYLRNRRQRVSVNGHFSPETAVSSAVPQGSCLGPVLYNLAVDKLAKEVRGSTRTYADDIVLSKEIDTPDDGNLIPIVTETKCLGVTFSSKLNWTAHVENVCA